MRSKRFSYWALLFFLWVVTACNTNTFLVPGGKGCVDCWKCCLFDSYYRSFDKSYCQRECVCNFRGFCNSHYDCGDGLYCSFGVNPSCKSCFECDSNRCTDRCVGVNNTYTEDAVFKTFLNDPNAIPNKHSFLWNCPQRNHSTSPIGCPCNRKLNISCVVGSSCVSGIFGKESDIVLTGGVLDYGTFQGICQRCKEGQLCVNGYDATPCPPGSFCPDPTSVNTCPPGFFCPQSSTNPLSCLYAGVYKGNICEKNASIGNTLCPKGYYCPNVKTKILCPHGFFCKLQSVTPRPCPSLTSCIEGSSHPQGSSGIVWIIVAVVIAFGVFVMIVKYMLNRNYDNEKHNTILTDAHAIPSLQIDEIHYKQLCAGTWLANNSGMFKGTQLNAIMGSSGCGKSTLIELLRGRVEPRHLSSGEVEVVFKSYESPPLNFRVNKDDMDLKRFRKLIGFVPQDDLVFGDLTVRENLMYSHEWKLGKKSSNVIEDVLCYLGLLKIANKTVGSVQKRGISGGQRKRVNIGMELVGIHPLIIMDEPTSGLDSTGSFEVLKYVQHFIEKYGVTFVCVVHQPRFSSFMLFDHLTLLGKTGCVFSGSPTECLAYFSLGLGASLNYNDNPGDAIMDLITYGFASKEEVCVDAKTLPELWITKGYKWMSQFKTRVGDCDNLLSHNYNLDALLKNILINGSGDEGVYDAYKLIKFFEHNGGIVIAYKDAQRFLGGNTITANEFIRRWTEICSSQGLNNVSDTLMLAKLERVISYGAPQSILFDTAIDRWKKIRVDALVIEFIHKLYKKMGKDPSTILRGGNLRETDWRDVLKGEILYTTLRIKAMRLQENPTGKNVQAICANIDCKRPPILMQMVALIRRRWNNFQRSPWFVQLCVTMTAALIVGAIHGSEWDMGGFSGNIVMAMACIGVLGMVTHVRTFSIDKEVMSREIKNGLPLTACLISYGVIDALWLFIIPCLYFAIYYYMTFPTADIGWFMLTGIMVEWWVSGMAYIVSFLPIGAAWVNLVGVFISIVFGAFINGINPTVADVKGGIGEVILGLSYNRWAMEIMTLKELDSIWDVQPETVIGITKRLGLCGYDSDFSEKEKLNFLYQVIDGASFNQVCSHNITIAFIVLFAEGVAFRVLAWLLYWLGWNGYTLKALWTKIYEFIKLGWHHLLRCCQHALLWWKMLTMTW